MTRDMQFKLTSHVVNTIITIGRGLERCCKTCTEQNVNAVACRGTAWIREWEEAPFLLCLLDLTHVNSVEMWGEKNERKPYFEKKSISFSFPYSASLSLGRPSPGSLASLQGLCGLFASLMMLRAGFVAYEMKVSPRTLPNGLRTQFNAMFLTEQLWLHLAEYLNILVSIQQLGS